MLRLFTLGFDQALAVAEFGRVSVCNALDFLPVNTEINLRAEVCGLSCGYLHHRSEDHLVCAFKKAYAVGRVLYRHWGTSLLGNFPLPNELIEKLKDYRDHLYTVGNGAVSLKRKRQKLQTGKGLGLLALALPPIIVTLASLIKG